MKKINNEIKELLKKSKLITLTEEEKLIKIPYGNDGDFIIPVFSDEKELEKGMEYFRLNEMVENKTTKTVKLEYFKKVKENQENIIRKRSNIKNPKSIIVENIIWIASSQIFIWIANDITEEEKQKEQIVKDKV